MIVAPDLAPTPEVRQAIRGCGRKVWFRSRKYAAKVASDLRTATGEPFEHYHCHRHHCWHVGHPKSWHAAQVSVVVERFTEGPLAGVSIIRTTGRGILPHSAPRVLSSRSARGRQTRP